MESWINRLRRARVTYCDRPELPNLGITKKRDVSYAFEDGSEMVEFYSFENFQLIGRIVGPPKWRNKTLTWDCEVGEFDAPKEFDKYLSWDEYKKPKEILDLEAQIVHEIRDKKDVEWIPAKGHFLLPMFLAGYDECNNAK